MAILGKILKFVVGFLFTLFLGFLIVIPGIIQLTKYENLKSTIVEVLTKRLVSESGDQLKQVIENGKNICSTTQQEMLEIPYGDSKLEIKCAEIDKTTPSDISKRISEKLFDSVYFKKYSCNFLDCLRELEGNEKFLIFVNEKGHNFFNQILIYIIMLVFVFGIVLAVLIRDVFQISKYFGITFIIAGIPLFLTGSLTKIIPVPLEMFEELQPLLDKIFKPINLNFTTILILGIILTAIGYIGTYLRNKRKK